MRFSRSAFIYDALTHVATPLPDMPCARHGCGGARIGNQVYVLGGGYCDREGTMCSVLDLATRQWSALPSAELTDEQISRVMRQVDRGTTAAEYSRMESALREPAAFVPVGAGRGRLVMLLGGLPLALLPSAQPADPEAGWHLAAPSTSTAELGLGLNAQVGDRF